MTTDKRNIIGDAELHFGYAFRADDGSTLHARGYADVTVDDEGTMYVKRLYCYQSPLIVGMLLTAETALAITDPGPANRPAELTVTDWALLEPVQAATALKVTYASF